MKLPGVRALILLKKQVDPWLYRARYRDTVGLTGPDGIRASVFVDQVRLLIPFARVAAEAAAPLLCDTAALGMASGASARVWGAGAADQPGSLALTRDSAGVSRVPWPDCAAGVIEIPQPDSLSAEVTPAMGRDR